jgi:hypothetical protein
MNQIAIAAGSGWQVRKANPTSKRPAGCETRVIAKFAGQDSVCAFCEHLSGRPVDHIADVRRSLTLSRQANGRGHTGD